MNRALAAYAAALLLATYALALALYLPGIAWPFDGSGNAVGRDFVCSWAAGRLAAAGDAPLAYDPATLHERQETWLGGEFPDHVFAYPPPYLFVCVPFGLLAYGQALLAWTVVTLLWWPLAAPRAWRRGLRLVLFLLAPALAIDLFSGQNGVLTALLLVGALNMLERRPLLAGVLLGGLVVKPQLALLVPLALLVGRRYRTFVAAATTAVVLVLLSAATFGVAAWTSWWTAAVPAQRAFTEEWTGLFLWLMPTPFAAARLAGFAAPAAYLATLPFALLAAAGVIAAWRRGGPHAGAADPLLVAPFLASPHAYAYDMTLVAAAVAARATDARTTGWRRGERAVAATAWCLPLALPLLPLAPFVLAALLLYLVARCRARNASIAR